MPANKSEAEMLQSMRHQASQAGARIWRNNVGAATTKDGSYIRFGLANESAAHNKVIKSADLIGIRPIVITQEMVGKTIGQFVSIEVKCSNWKYSGTEREKAQLAWRDLILSLGGYATMGEEKY